MTATKQPQTVREAIDQQQWQAVPALVEQAIQNTLPERRALMVSRIANMLSHAGRTDDTLHYFKKALDISTDAYHTMQIQGWIATMLGEHPEHHATAKHYATLSLAARDQLVQRDAVHKKMVAFSLYGSKPAYCETLILNAKAMKTIYPDWTMRVYHDHTIPNHMVPRLKLLNVECVDVATINASHMPGTFWRFLALEDWNYDVVIMRDADSVISEREKILVDEWLASDKPFHVVRDWYGHTDLILAGLWGARGGFLGDIRARIDHYLTHEKDIHPTHADQFFLAKHVWTRIKPYCMHHSSLIPFEGATWSEQLEPIHRNHHQQIFQLGSWRLSNYQPQTDKPYKMYLADVYPDGKENIFCEYLFENGEAFELPREYREAIDAGRMKLFLIPQK